MIVRTLPKCVPTTGNRDPPIAEDGQNALVLVKGEKSVWLLQIVIGTVLHYAFPEVHIRRLSERRKGESVLRRLPGGSECVLKE
jgi:hypothetical protein